MATPLIINHSQLLHALVLDRASTEDLGRVDVVWMYPQAHRVLGFICKPGALSQKRLAFNLPQIHSLNTTGQPKTVWVHSKATETTVDQVRQLQTLLGHEVWTESGQVLGKVVDCTFNLRTGEIQDYWVALKGLRGMVAEPFLLKPEAILSFGSKRLLVTPSVAKGMTDQEDRIKQTLGELKQEYQQVREEIKSFSSQAQTLIQRAGSKVQRVGTKVGTKAQQWAQGALETAQSTGQTWQEELPKQVGDWRDRAQDFAAPFFDSPGDSDLDPEWDPDPAGTTDWDWGPKPPPQADRPVQPHSPQSPTSNPAPGAQPQAASPQAASPQAASPQAVPPRPASPQTVSSQTSPPQPGGRSAPDRVVYPPQVTDDFGDDLGDEANEAWADDVWGAATPAAATPRGNNWDEQRWDGVPGQPIPVEDDLGDEVESEAEIWDQWTLDNPAADSAQAPQSPPRSAPQGSVPPRAPQTPTPPNPAPETLNLDEDPWL